MIFEIHPQLKENLLLLGKLTLSQVFLMPDSENPWLVLVPQVAQITEWHQLTLDQQSQLQLEMNLVSQVIVSEFKPDKINIGALGNIVSQFHLHIMGRYKNDRAWPAPLWGTALGNDQVIIDKNFKIFKDKLSL